MFSIYNAAGRGGAGAVMGSKNLKAIAVRGNGHISTANPKLYHQRVKEAKESLKSDSGYEGMGLYGTSGSLYGINELKVFPSYNYQRSSVDDITTLTGQNFTDGGYLKRKVGCFSCIISCHRFGTVDSGPFAGSYSGGPEYETMSACGSGCGILDIKAVMRINELINLYGMDTISTGGVIQWAMECYEKGVIGEEELDGLDLKWGNSLAVVEMVKRIANREGFGDVLAEGVKRASEKVGGESYKWAVQAKGLEQSRVDTRSAKSYALAFAVNPRGADHLHTQTFAEFGMGPEARDLIKKIAGDENLATPYITNKRSEIVRWHEDCYAVTDCLGFCSFTSTALYGITPKIMADLYSAALGVNVSEKEIMECGRRIVTLEKCFNVRLGATRKDDTLPYRMMHDPTPDRPDVNDAVNTKEELDMMLDEYYALHGWDKETSRPTRKNLVMLGLEYVAEELDSMNLIGQEKV
jgi:aldehyde:ferredoxin oxidoreductase